MSSLSGSQPATMRPGAPGGRSSAIASSRFDAGSSDRDALVERLRRREHAALEEFYDAYAGRAYGLAYRVVGDPSAAEDAVHDAFLWFWEHADRIDASKGNAGALLLTITHRRAIDHLRRRKRLDGRGSTALDMLEPVDEAALELLERMEDAPLIERMRSAVAHLNSEQREVLELAYYGGLTHEEISRRQQLPLGTVKSRLRLGLQKLRGCLQQETPR